MRAKAAMDAGGLVSDDIVLGLIRERVSRPDAANGFILDGYPRNVAQAGALDALLAELNKPIDSVVFMNVDARSLLLRLTGRRTCPVCGKVFNVYTSPSAKGDRCDNPEHGGAAAGTAAARRRSRGRDRESAEGLHRTDQSADRALRETRTAAGRERRPAGGARLRRLPARRGRLNAARPTASARAARRLRRAANHAATGSSPARPTHTRAPRRRAAWRALRFRCRGCQPLRAPPS